MCKANVINSNDNNVQSQKKFNIFFRKDYGQVASVDIDRRFILRAVKASFHADLMLGRLDDEAQKIYRETVCDFLNELLNVIEEA